MENYDIYPAKPHIEKVKIESNWGLTAFSLVLFVGVFLLLFKDEIVIKGARTHNLRNINLTIPRNKMVVISGLSGKLLSSDSYPETLPENLQVIVEHIYSQIESASTAISKNEKNLPKRLKNLILKKDLVQIILQDLRQKNFDIFTANFSAKKLTTKFKFLFRALR